MTELRGAPAAADQGTPDEHRTPADPRTRSETFDGENLGPLFNSFQGDVHIQQAVFGASGPGTASPHQATGRVDDKDIRGALEHFVRPAVFDVAATRLVADQIVVLRGRPGIGRRSSALALLREVTGDALFMLSPQVTLAELSTRDYNAGCGYLLLDRPANQEAGDSDFEWLLVRDRLRAQGAFLVVTGSSARAWDDSGVAQLAWAAPDAERVLRARWSVPWPPDEAESLAEALARIEFVADAVALATRLAAGDSVDSATGHLDSRLAKEVAQWFDTGPDRTSVATLAALAFTTGADERTLESSTAVLLRHLDRHVPEPPVEGSEGAGLAQHRLLYNRNPLIRRVRLPTTFGSRGALVFADPGHHRHVVNQLWTRMGVAFWDALHDCLRDIVALGDFFERSTAFGLAVFASAAVEEVLPLLVEWSRGELGSAGQRAAVYALWFMARDDALSASALQIATAWSKQGNPAQRWVGATAFGGQLGAQYPHDAVNVLWQISTQPHTVTGSVELLFGKLFATLVHNGGDAEFVLAHLRAKLDRFPPLGRRPELRRTAVRCTAAVLSATDATSGRYAFVSFLDHAPDRLLLVARLWADVLLHRPERQSGIRTMRAALESMGRHEGDPRPRAEALGAALSAQLDAAELAALRQDFEAFLDRKGTGIGPIVAALLAALRTNPSDK
ncbi:hypothetical protein JOD54_001491 [Actinokineospora baliensis]|uniref:hypothetical protein n=1 Tax=Actinokineospora baliensis TaxID=547056 RepID=UPI00195A7DB2|nr:hypothetical protein [Actinokineospora baliensis]MBM7771287.1 hypothetical protein [Actinokineospora baliensis]